MKEVAAAQIIKMTESHAKMLGQSTSVICKAEFEMDDVKTPSCFMVLPYELPEPDKEVTEEEEQSRLDSVESWIGDVTGLVEEGAGIVKNPLGYAKSFLASAFKGKVSEVKSKLKEKTLYLYLVDEFTGKAAFDPDGVYPVKISENSEFVDKYMPMMQMGLQAVSMANGAAGLVNMFFPMAPGAVVLKGLMAKAQGFVDGLNKEADYGEDDGEEDGGAKSGGAKRVAAEINPEINSVKALLAMLKLDAYFDTLAEGGHEELGDLEDLSQEELENDCGMKRPNAKRIVKHFAGK